MIFACADMDGTRGDLKIVGSFFNHLFESVSSSTAYFSLDNFLLPSFLFSIFSCLVTTMYSSHCQNVERTPFVSEC